MFRSVFGLGLVGVLAVAMTDFGASTGIDSHQQLVFKVKGLT
jgi:hypothetical protein